LEDYIGMMRNSESRMTDEIELLHRYFVFPETDDPDVGGLCEDVILSAIEAMGDIYAKYKGKGRKEVNDLMKYMLPESFRTSLVWTINIRSLNNFLKLRSDKGSHFEIRKLAGLVYEEAVKTPYKNLIFDINKEERSV
jgi:thymidylate synthase ThyX